MFNCTDPQVRPTRLHVIVSFCHLSLMRDKSVREAGCFRMESESLVFSDVWILVLLVRLLLGRVGLGSTHTHTHTHSRIQPVTGRGSRSPAVEVILSKRQAEPS